MYNTYVINITTEEGFDPSLDINPKRVVANIAINEKYFGRLFQNNNSLQTKEEFVKFFTSLGTTIYGQEDKASEEEKSFDTVLGFIGTADSPRQKE